MVITLAHEPVSHAERKHERCKSHDRLRSSLKQVGDKGDRRLEAAGKSREPATPCGWRPSRGKFPSPSHRVTQIPLEHLESAGVQAGIPLSVDDGWVAGTGPSNPV